MPKIYSFHLRIEDSNFVFKSETHKEMFKRWLAQWNGEEITLDISEKKSKRSGQQNRYYRLYLGIISEETGQGTPDELHDLFKGKFLTSSIREIFGFKTRITKSTTTLTKSEFAEYLVNISALTQIELPDTTLYFGDSYHK